MNLLTRTGYEILTGTVDLFFIKDLLFVTKSELVFCFSVKAGFIFDGNKRFVAKLHISAWFQYQKSAKTRLKGKKQSLNKRKLY